MDREITMFLFGIILGLGFGVVMAVQWVMPPVKDNLEKYYEQKLVTILREAGREDHGTD